MMTNNERLRELIAKYKLDRENVAELLHLPLSKSGQSAAVNKWLSSPADPGNFRRMSDAMLELLELKLGERELVVVEYI